jgi:uncharacterized protein YbaP (TraB family)
MRFWKNAALAMAAMVMAAACGEKTPDAAPAEAPAVAKGPALWKIGDADTTVYLFGTVHVLPPELSWRKPPVDKALGESKAIYFETDLDPDLNEMLPIIQQLGMYPQGEKLSDHLKPDDRTALEAAAEKLQTPMVALEQMKPWLAAVTLSERMITNAGYDVNSGVERRLAPDAKSAGKEIRKLETVEEQLLVFADLPEAVQIRFLMDGVKEIDEESTILDEMVNAWATGDVEKLNEIMIEEDLAENPEIYAALLVDRNANWVTEIDQLIKSEPGTFFFAVGAAHLTGKDSVMAKLVPLGYTAERVE